VVEKIAHNVLVARIGSSGERGKACSSGLHWSCVNASASLDTALNRRDVAVERGPRQVPLAVLLEEVLSDKPSDDCNDSEQKDNGSSLCIHERRG